MSKLHELTAFQIKNKIENKEISAEEIVQSVFDRIHNFEEKINAFVTLVEDKALKKAKEIDVKISKGKTIGKLAGLPIGIKDAICTKGIPTTCSSQMLQNFVPPYDPGKFPNKWRKMEADMPGPSMAAATIAIVPIIIVYLFFQRNFISGMAMSGLKA